MLETIREYGRARLTASGEMETTRRKHAEYFATVAEQAAHAATLRTGWMASRLWPTELEQADLQRAFEWAIDDQDGPRALRLASVLTATGMLRSGSLLSRQRLAAAFALPGADEPTPVRALAVERRGVAAMDEGDYSTAQNLLLEALGIYEGLDDERAVGFTLVALCRVARRQNLHDEARALGERALHIFRRIGDPSGLASALHGFGQQALFEEDLRTARAYFEEAVATARHPVALYHLAIVERDEDHLSEARKHLAEYMGMVRVEGTVTMIALGLEGFAILATAEAQPERVFRLAGAAAAFRRARNTPLPPSGRLQLDRWLAPASDALDDSARAAAWAAGEGMTLDEAVDYALSHDDSHARLGECDPSQLSAGRS